MALVDRVKNILLSPQTEWPTIAAESATVQSILTGYVLILAAIGPLALAIDSWALASSPPCRSMSWRLCRRSL